MRCENSTQRIIMENNSIKKAPIDKWVLEPIKSFISKSSTSGIILFSSAFVAIIITNSPWSSAFHHFWEIEFSVGFNGAYINKSLHHWINDGLMAVFFFVVGLELKREIIAGELNEPKKAVLPIAGALGGMLFPAIVYFLFNRNGETMQGWGIPMATDIAFALGVLYLLGDKVPISLKIFLTALAIADDLGAVLVIAFFYTSEINFSSLVTAGIFLLVLVVSNFIGIRNTLYYALIGIGGVWLFFLMSGVHATIAAVLAAFTIPASVKISEAAYITRLESLTEHFKQTDPNNKPTVTNDQLHILEEIRDLSKNALTPLQRLEHGMHPLVAFVIMPIFALSNAGVEISGDIIKQVTSPVTMGIFFGLLFGKFIGVTGVAAFMIKMKWAALPEGMNYRHLMGAGLLAGIGFTMSLFVAGLAFDNELYMVEARLGILAASLTASVAGFFVIKSAAQ